MIIYYVRNLIEKQRAAHNRRATMKALSGLNDHMLKDIGLERGDILSVANNLANQPTPEIMKPQRGPRDIMRLCEPKMGVSATSNEHLC